MTRALRLELAQYHELLDFAQFGTELDEIANRRLARGERAMEILKQPQYVTYSFVDQALMLLLLQQNLLDTLEVAQVGPFVTQFVSYVKSVYQDVYKTIEQTEDIDDDTKTRLIAIAQEFSKLFVAPGK